MWLSAFVAKKMKIQSKYLFIIKIAIITLLSLLVAWLFVRELYFSASLFLIVIISLSVSIYFDRKKLIYKMKQLISGIRNADFSLHFPKKETNDELDQLSNEMESALQVFRERTQNSLMDEAETEAWQKLISVLTHEIMNSIAPIISLSETLSEQEVTENIRQQEYEQMKQSMEIIHRRSEGLLKFVENYRKLTRIPNPMLQPIAMNSFLQSLHQLTTADKLTFSYSVYPEQLILMADANLLEQMLINLLKNAQEACAEIPDCKICMKVQQVGDEVEIIVSDNGKGISPEALDKIFIPFYSTKSHGSGIGLSLCRQIMVQHKGKISAKSDEKDTEIKLVFPS